MNQLSKEQKKLCDKIYEDTQVDVAYFLDQDDIESYDDLYEAISDDCGFDIEIIYYDNAIDYLKENDSSLKESMNIAHEYGYTTDKLNSELLASLHASENARIDFQEYEDAINEVLFCKTQD